LKEFGQSANIEDDLPKMGPMNRTVGVLLLALPCSLASHDVQGQADSRAHLQAIQRDLRLERAVSERYTEITTYLQPETRRKLTLASAATRKRITTNPEHADPYETAQGEVNRRFPRLPSAQVDLLTFCVLADLARQGKDEIEGNARGSRYKLDNLSEMGEMESLRLQMAMDRLSKLMSTLSNILKKISETSDGITRNMK